MITPSQLYRLRLELDETQDEFARHFDVDQATISRWEANGPPSSGPVAKWIGLVMAKLKEKIKDEDE